MSKMPDKDPNLWLMIWGWLQGLVGTEALRSALAAIFISFLRIGFMRKKPSFRYRVLDAAICASIAGVTVPICSHMFGHNDFSPFVGTMIGFIGTEKIREFLFKFINHRVSDSDISLGGGSKGGYDDTNFRE